MKPGIKTQSKLPHILELLALKKVLDNVELLKELGFNLDLNDPANRTIVFQSIKKQLAEKNFYI